MDTSLRIVKLTRRLMTSYQDADVARDRRMGFPERTITELAVKYGVSLRTLRFYEDRGLLQPIRRRSARFYTLKDEIRLQLILKGKRFGFTLSEIHRLIEGPPFLNIEKPNTECADLTAILKPDDIMKQIELLEKQQMILHSAIDELRGKLAG